jgi:hypothetical protein
MQPFWIEAKKRWAIEIPKRMSPTGKAQRKLFATRDAAREFCSGRKEEHNEHGKASITAEERAVIVSVRDRLGDLSILPTVIDHWLATGVVLNPIGAKDAAKAFLDAVKADYGNKRTWHDVKVEDRVFRRDGGSASKFVIGVPGSHKHSIRSRESLSDSSGIRIHKRCLVASVARSARPDRDFAQQRKASIV